jgi:hypothetical protein
MTQRPFVNVNDIELTPQTPRASATALVQIYRDRRQRKSRGCQHGHAACRNVRSLRLSLLGLHLVIGQRALRVS